MTNNPKEVLKAMPASSIQRIEVITNPSSKYDAEGVAGIINIVMIKNIKNGSSGNVSFNYQFPVGGPGEGGSFTLQHNKLTLNIYEGAALLRTPVTNKTLSQKGYDIEIEQIGRNNSNQKNGYVGGELGYEIDSLKLLSFEMNAYANKNNENVYETSQIIKSIPLESPYSNSILYNERISGFDAGVDYQIGFKKDKTQLLTFSYKFLNYNNNQNNSSIIENIWNSDLPTTKQNNVGRFQENTGQIDFAKNIKKTKIEAGIKNIYRINNSDFGNSIFDSVRNFYYQDTASTDSYKNYQNIAGAYTSLSFDLKNFFIRTGARVENTTVNAMFVTSGTLLKLNYLNVIPSFFANKTINNNLNLNFGFNQRIKRPGINRLNPFVDRSNPLFISSGNPKLKAVVNNNMQLGLSYSKRINLISA